MGMGETATSTTTLNGTEPIDPDAVFLQMYEELRRVARARLRDQPVEHTLQTTALVHEAFIKLQGSTANCDRRHFLRLAAEAMRQILIDHARTKCRLKRGGKETHWEAITDIASLTVNSDSDAILALEDALRRLEKVDPSAAEVIALRFLNGLSIQETAEVTGLSGTTVNRKWKFARAWLFKEMGLNHHGRLRINSPLEGAPAGSGI